MKIKKLIYLRQKNQNRTNLRAIMPKKEAMGGKVQMNLLSDKQMIDAYFKAKEIKQMDSDFIKILEEQLLKRGILKNIQFKLFSENQAM